MGCAREASDEQHRKTVRVQRRVGPQSVFFDSLRRSERLDLSQDRNHRDAREAADQASTKLGPRWRGDLGLPRWEFPLSTRGAMQSIAIIRQQDDVFTVHLCCLLVLSASD